jgi:hypothetical protein
MLSALLKLLAVSSAPYEAFRGCFVTSPGPAAYIGLYCLSAIDTGALFDPPSETRPNHSLVILVLMGLSAYRARSPVERVGDGHTISSIAHQDGWCSILLAFHLET